MRLLLKPTVLLATSEDGYLAFDTDSGQLHRLNPLAALIAELANGQLSCDDLLQEVVSVSGSASADPCAKWIAQATTQGLLVDAGTVSQVPARTAAELAQLATELRNNNCVLAAFLCQQRAAELAPEDPLVWCQLGELAHMVGCRAEARAAYERYQAAYPNDAEVEHLLIALRDEAPPARVSDRCIEQLYSQFASFYDRNMCVELDYRAPDLLIAALAVALESRRELVALDAGCGTGLLGRLLKPYARRLVGVDLSGAMVELAAQRGIYDQLHVAELTSWWTCEPAEHFDVIAICDTLIYFGDLTQILSLAERHLARGGLLGFTVEKSESSAVHLTDSGRFAHHQNHLLAGASAGGYSVVSQTEEVLRYEYGAPVVGWVTVLRGGQ